MTPCSDHFFTRCSRTVLLIFLVILCAVETEAQKLRAAEEWVRQKLATGEVAYLKDRFPQESDRVISAAFLKRLLTTKIPGTMIASSNIRIRDAIIKDFLNLTNEEVPYAVEIDDSQFKAGAVFLSTHFKRRLDLEGSSFYQSVDFRYATVDGEFNAAHTHFLAPGRDDTDQKSGSIYEANFENFKTSGPVSFANAVFDGRVSFYAAQCGNFEAPSARFNDAAIFELMEARGHVFFTNADFNGKTRFYRTKVSENFEADGAHFNDFTDGADFEGLTANTVRFRRDEASQRETTFNGPARFYRASISTNFEADDAQFNSSANFEDMSIKGHALFRRTVFARAADFSSSTIERSFDLSDARFYDRISSLDFDDLDANVLNVEKTTFPNRIAVSGLTFRQIQPGAVNDFRKLITTAQYDAGAYARLEDYYRQQGNPSEANRLYISRRWRERSQLSYGWDWIVNLIFASVGYGRRPEWVIFPTAVILGIGCYVFRSKRLMETRHPELQLSNYNPFIYSLDLFLPIVDLQSANIWQPAEDRRWAQWYLVFHVLAGWILVTILVAALTGLLK